MNIVVPMAGRGSRFSNEGYHLPKPLIDVCGYPMIEWVIRNIQPDTEHKFIFICQEQHYLDYDLGTLLPKIAGDCDIIQIKDVTEGAACTVMLAEALIDNDTPLMIANSDQWVDIDINSYLNNQGEADGFIMTMTADDPKWSFIRIDDATNHITEVVEKEVISNEATVGIYNFARGQDFCRAARVMFDKNLRVNNEFYVAPAYNILIEEGAHIRYHNIGTVTDGMYGLGTPADLNDFLESPVLSQVLKKMKQSGS